MVVESVLIVPVIMLVLALMVQMVLWARASQVVNVAAAEGARAALSAGGGTAAGVDRARAVLAASGSAVESSDVVAQEQPGHEVVVTVEGRAVSLFPWVSFPVAARQKGPVQEFRS